MNVNEALNVLNLSGETITQEEIKAAYRSQANKYHPDKAQPADQEKYTEMMKMINTAYDFLKSLGKDIHVNVSTSKFYDFCKEIEDVLDRLYQLDGLIVEVCGNWVWITGNTKKHAPALGKNGIGCFYASKKQAWYYRPEEHKSSNHGGSSLDDIRARYGSIRPGRKGRQSLPGEQKDSRQYGDYAAA